MSVFGPDFFILPPERQISLPKRGTPSIQNVRGPPYGFGQKSTIIEDSEFFLKLEDPFLDTKKLSSCLYHSGLSRFESGLPRIEGCPAVSHTMLIDIRLVALFS